MKSLKYYTSTLKDKLKFSWKYVSSFFVAVFGPTISLDVYLDRLNVCKECKWNKQKATRNYCAECFCPQTKFFYFSELKFKASLKNAKCPRKKWEN